MNAHIIPPPDLPEDAPFDSVQRIWLKGFFDGLSAIQQSMESVLPVEIKVHILWGSQTGSSEGLAKKVAKKWKSSGWTVDLRSLADVVLEDLLMMEFVAIITSTYGDGEAPDNAKMFHQQLMIEDEMDLSNLHYSVYALGDSTYPDFCRCGKEIDEKLAVLGAARILDRVECDVDYEAPLNSWLASFVETVAK